MGCSMNRKWKKYSTVIGAVLLIMPNGLFWYWGNLSVYTLSYFVFMHGSHSNVKSPWLVSSFFITWTLFTLLSASLAKRIGRRYTILLGATVSDTAIFMSYFAVQSSLTSLTLTLGGVLGIGTGLIDSSAIQMVMDWADDDTGRLSSVVQGSFSLGSFVLNQLITLYLNPENLSPDVNMAEGKYFSQKRILDEVPNTYLVLGTFAFISHVTGFLMMRQAPKNDETVALHVAFDGVKGEAEGGNSQTRSIRENGFVNSDASPKTKFPAFGSDHTPWEMLQTKLFLIIWITSFVGLSSILIVGNYYKFFGQIWIEDDHFLTDTGTVMVLGNAFFSFFWGMFMDKYGVKNCFVVNQFPLVPLMGWYYFTPRLSKWLYFLVTFSMGILMSGVFPCYTAAIAMIYGKKHFSTNLGLLFTATLTVNLAAPVVLESILSYAGWIGMFNLGSVLCLIRLILLVCFLPQL